MLAKQVLEGALAGAVTYLKTRAGGGGGGHPGGSSSVMYNYTSSRKRVGAVSGKSLRRFIKSRRRRSRRMKTKRKRYAKARQLFPSKRRVKMTWVHSFTQNAATFTAGQFNYLGSAVIMKANSIWHPNSAYGAGGRINQNPSSYLFFSQLYNRYIVKSSHYRLTYRQINTTQCTPFVMGVKLSDGSSVADHSYEQLGNDNNVKWKVVRPTADGSCKASVSGGFRAGKRFGIGVSHDNYADMASDPPDVEYFVPFFQFKDDSATSFPACHISLSVTYYVEFSDPKDVHGSLTDALDQE